MDRTLFDARRPGSWDGLRFSLPLPLALALAAAASLGGREALSAQVGADTIRSDTLAADTVFHNLPAVEPAGPAGWVRGVWVWEHNDILTSGALTLAELVADVPGVLALPAGDYGTPVGLTAFGMGGGRVRILRDGFEVVPLEGGVADLSRIGLVGIERVRLERSLGELVIRLEGLEHTDGRTYSLVEAGTGDQNTNFFRGAFADPVALGGSVGLGLERVDARGAMGNEPGSITGSWLRYQLHRGDAAGLALEWRRMGSESAAPLYASPVTRTDLTVRGRARVAQGVVAEAYWGKANHDVGDQDTTYALEGGSRSQLGARASLLWGPLSAAVAWRSFGGDDLPSRRLDLEGGLDEPRLGGLDVSRAAAAWEGTATRATRVRIWTRPLLGLSLFGSLESGSFGARVGPVRVLPAADSARDAKAGAVVGEPTFRVSDGRGTRVGVQWRGRKAALSGALLRLEMDSLLALGIEPDRAQPPLAGGKRSGWEVWGRLPTPWDPLVLEGALQQWDEEWSYLPRRAYTAALSFHAVYLSSGNFEWWWSVGVRGHDPMTVRQPVGTQGTPGQSPAAPQLATVPFYQNWYLRMQIRIVSMRIFVNWENFAVRRDLQKYPGRLLPITRAVYGIRWTLWN